MSPSRRRQQLVGFKYRVGDSVEAEVRKSCRDELKILYAGGPFTREAWARLAALGEASVFEASKINAKMKDLIRVRGDGVRIEGALDGELVVAFFEERRRSEKRHLLESLLSRPAAAKIE